MGTGPLRPRQGYPHGVGGTTGCGWAGKLETVQGTARERPRTGSELARGSPVYVMILTGGMKNGP